MGSKFTKRAKQESKQTFSHKINKMAENHQGYMKIIEGHLQINSNQANHFISKYPLDKKI